MNRTLGMAFATLLLSFHAQARSVSSDRPYRPPRLADGHADLEGIWKNSNLTPLERPAQFAQLKITAADALKLQREYLGGAEADSMPDDPGRELEDRSVEPIRGELRSSQIVDPIDGRLPWNEEHRDAQAAVRRAAASALDNPEERPPAERCLASNGAPPMVPTLDNNLYHLIQTPSIFVILSELIHDARLVRMNGSHPYPPVLSWLGDSIGWWDKDTLVVETKDFAPTSAVRYRPRDNFLVSPQTVVVERFTRVSDHELNYLFIVTDPTLYSRPWTGETHLMKSSKRLYEYACHEGNYSMRNILEAAREREQAAKP